MRSLRRVFLPTLLVLPLAAAPARAIWSSAGNPVCTAPGFQGELIALPVRPSDLPIAPVQSMFVLWSDARDSIPAVTDLYSDFVDPLGGVSTPNGSPVVVAPGFQGYTSAAPTAEAFLSGGNDFIVAWNDNRNGALDVYVKELFFVSWPADGVPVCTAAGIQHAAQIAGTATGGGIVAWLDQRSGGDAVYAQRLDRDGIPQWTTNGIPVCTLPYSRSALRIARDGAGGAYVGWVDSRGGAPRTYVTRLDPTGAPAAGWSLDGLEVTSLAYAALDRLVADGAGGVYVTMWVGDFPRAQRLDAGGTVHAGWPADGVPLRATPIGGNLQDAVRHGDGLVVLWAEDDAPDETFAMNLRAQRLLGDGTRASGWGPDGVVVCDAPGEQGRGRLVDGPPIIAVWEDGRTFGSDPDVYAGRLADDGTRPIEWPANGVLIAGGNGRQSSPCPTWDGVGGVMIAYLDDHDFNSYETDVYVQIVNLVGQVDVPRRLAGGSSLAAPVPNPAARAVSLALAWPAGVPACAEVVDVLGRRVRALGEVRGATTLRWDLADDAGRRVSPGLYVVRAHGGDHDLARTVVVRR